MLKHDSAMKGEPIDSKIDFDFFSKHGFATRYDTATLTLRLNQLFGNEIENQETMKMFVDGQFKNTQKIIYI